jgi:hypothetical protein
MAMEREPGAIGSPKSLNFTPRVKRKDFMDFKQGTNVVQSIVFKISCRMPYGVLIRQGSEGTGG